MSACISYSFKHEALSHQGTSCVTTVTTIFSGEWGHSLDSEAPGVLCAPSVTSPLAL